MTGEHPLEYVDSVLRENRRLESELAACLEHIGKLESLARRMLRNVGFVSTKMHYLNEMRRLGIETRDLEHR